MKWIDLAILSLAAFRLSLLVSKEDGPYWIFQKLRRIPPPKSSTRQGLSCQWCTSMWAALLIVLLFLVWNNIWTMGFLYVLAVSGAAICWNQAFTKGG